MLFFKSQCLCWTSKGILPEQGVVAALDFDLTDDNLRLFVWLVASRSSFSPRTQLRLSLYLLVQLNRFIFLKMLILFFFFIKVLLRGRWATMSGSSSLKRFLLPFNKRRGPVPDNNRNVGSRWVFDGTVSWLGAKTATEAFKNHVTVHRFLPPVGSQLFANLQNL